MNSFIYLNSVFSFRSTLTSQSTNVIGLDYVVDGQLVTQLDGNETVSLNFLKKVKTKGNKVSGKRLCS